MGPTTRALFAEVYARPDDDAPRLVLADHLLELGDPRGEFLALQLAKGKPTPSARRKRRRSSRSTASRGSGRSPRS